MIAESRATMSGRTALRVALIGAVLAIAGVAAAEPTTAERETARSLMDEGDSFRQAGDFARALERYQAADAIMHVPTTGLEVARAQAKLARLVDACTSAIGVANSAPASGEPIVFAQARAAAQVLVEQLRPRVPSLTLQVEPIGVAYELRFDGVLVPDDAHSLPYKLDPGQHVVLVQAPGYRPFTERIALAESQRIERRIRLIASAPPPRLTPPPTAASEPPRPEPAATVRAKPTLDPNTAGRARGYVALGIGGAVLVAGVVTGIVAVSMSEDAKEQCAGERCPPSAAPSIDRANTMANVSNVTLPLGALGIAYGLFELLTHLERTPDRARRSNPTLAISSSFSGQAGVSVRGEL
jgi:hypothetical protein